ncbi:MAG: DinB family protein [Dehalococcoidia bacterium]|nr:DinB family protein [Dehalococcoidia bacterium]MSQ34955.1 DinB family protein [Dehalococcoidia bacterium]
MDAVSVLAQQHLRNHSSRVGKPAEGTNQEDSSLQGLTDDQIRKVPQAGMNSVAWVLWHIARTEDGNMHILGGRHQVFEEGNWASKMKFADKGTGNGFTPEQVAGISRSIDLAALRDYRAAVGQRTQDILKSLKPADLDATVDMAAVRRAVSVGIFNPAPDLATFERNWSVRTKGYAVSLYAISHNVGHWGEVTTIKGLITAK